MDFILTTLISILVIIPFHYFVKAHNKKQRFAKYIDKLPGPKAVPLFGNALQLKVARNRKYLLEYFHLNFFFFKLEIAAADTQKNIFHVFVIEEILHESLISVGINFARVFVYKLEFKTKRTTEGTW